jgi:hypothetical protein
MNELKLYDKVCMQLDMLMREQGVDPSSMEGLNSNIIGRLFVGVIDTFGGLLSTWATNLTRCFKDLKRSELNEFTSSNMLKVATVERLTFDKAMNVAVDIPSNMKSTYIKAINSIVDAYVKLNAINNAKLADISFNEMITSINTGNKKLAAQISSTYSVITRSVAGAKMAVSTCFSQFDGKSQYKVEFSKVFNSMKELQDSKRILLDNEYRLQDVAVLAKLVESIEGSCKEMVKVFESNDALVTSKDLNLLSETAKNLALVVDAYGMAAMRQMTLEHNLILCINNIYDNAK